MPQLVSGTRIGPYEVIDSLGAGGMGEVYRATDTRLKRQVALKVLPSAVTSYADRLARFQREAAPRRGGHETDANSITWQWRPAGQLCG